MDPSTVKRYLPWVVATALFMDNSTPPSSTPRFPAMAASLQVTPLSLKAVVTSYILSLAVGIPVSGWMADRFGTDGCLASRWRSSRFPRFCAVWRSTPQCWWSRACCQGIGAAMMMPVGRLTIIRTFHKSELLVAMNFVIIPALIGPLLSPTVGGLIVHFGLSWREIFFVNVPGGPDGAAAGASLHAGLSRRCAAPLDRSVCSLFGTGTALLSGCWKSLASTTSTRLRWLCCSVVHRSAGRLTVKMYARLNLCCASHLFRVRTVPGFGGRRFHTRLGMLGCRFCCPCSINWVWDAPPGIGPIDDAHRRRRHSMKLISAWVLRRYGYRYWL